MTITFKAMTVSDIPLWQKWAEKPHVKDVWFLEGYASTSQILASINHNGYDHPFIVLLDNTPIGYIHCCDLYAYRSICPMPTGLFTHESKGTFCLDVFIGEESYLGQGYGTEIIKAFTQKLTTEYQATKIKIDPAASNHRAIRCYEKAGYRKIYAANDGVNDCIVMLYQAEPLRITIRETNARDEAHFIEAMEASIAYHHPWTTAPTTTQAFQTYLQRNQQDTQFSYLILAGDSDIAGVVNINEIVRGNFQSAYMGFYGVVGYEGRGYMTAGLTAVIDKAFGELDLHRLEANIQPGNALSIKLIKKLGFIQEGFSPKYLQINNEWCDHLRFAKLRDEDSDTKASAA